MFFPEVSAMVFTEVQVSLGGFAIPAFHQEAQGEICQSILRVSQLIITLNNYVEHKVKTRIICKVTTDKYFLCIC